MPYIEAKFSCKLDFDKKDALKTAFGKAIEAIPGKSESWLMVNIQDGKDIYFKGNRDGESAFISVAIFGKASPSDYQELTSILCEKVSQITGVSPDRTYITYSEHDKWGWNGSNF